MRGFRIGYARAVRISGDSGSYAKTGNVAALLKGYKTAADQGSYAVSGQTATLTIGGSPSGGATADWIARSNAPGVIWAHDFSADAELDNFIRGENTSGAIVTNPSPKPPGSLTLVSTPFGSARAIRSRAFGTTLTAATGSASDYPAHDTQTWSVADASQIPDPAGTPYRILVGNGTDSGGIEWVEVTAVNTGANTVTVRRKMTAENGGYGTNTAPNFPIGFTLGRGPNGSWNRPFGAFPATQNGKASADIGIANGVVTKQRSWSGGTTNSSAHANFREGYFGHRSYWADAPQTYKDWTPQDGGGARVDAWDGDEIYIQFRANISASRFDGPAAKMLFIQNAAVSGSCQFFWTVGPNKYGEQPPPAEQVPGVEYGTYLVGLTSYADSAAPAGGILGSVQSDTIDNGLPIQDGYPNSLYSQRPSNFLAWCFPAERWVTYLIHFKFGKDNAPADPNDTLPMPTAPFPSASDASYRTTYELYVADEGATAYQLITSGTDWTWFFGDGKFAPGTYLYNPPGINAFWMSQNLNDYVGAGSVSPPAQSHWIDYTQVIVSKNTIPVPDDSPLAGTALGDAINALSVGEFALFNSTWPGGAAAFWVPGGSSSESLLDFAHVGAWSTSLKRAYVCGAGYGDYRVVTYDATTNVWSWVDYPVSYIHSWDHVALDNARGYLYFGSQGGAGQSRVDLSNNSRVAAADPWGSFVDTYGMEFWPSLDITLFADRNGGLVQRNNAGSVSSFASGGPALGYDQFLSHNPVRNVMYWGGGNATANTFREVSTAGAITSLTAIPGAGVDCARQHAMCGDVTGDLVLFDFPNSLVRAYKHGTGWTTPSISWPGNLTEAGALTAALPIRGIPGKEVFMLFRSTSANPGTVYCYLYRYS